MKIPDFIKQYAPVFLTLLIVPAFLFSPSSARSNQSEESVIRLDRGQKSFELAPHSRYFHDVNGTMGIPEVTDLLSKGRFTVHKEGPLQFGYSQGNVWIYFEIYRPLHSETEWYFKNLDHMIGKIDLFAFEHETWVPFYSGGVEVESSPVYWDRVRASLTEHLTPGKTNRFLMEISGDYSLNVLSLIIEKNTMRGYQLKNYSFTIFVMGIVFSLALYNFFLFLSLRDPAYLFYSVFLFFGLIPYLAGQGVFFEFIYEVTGLSGPSMLSFFNNGMYAWSFTETLFVISFFHLYKNHPNLYRTMFSISLFLLGIWILHNFAWKETLLPLGEATTLILYIITLGIGIYLTFLRNPAAPYFLAAFGGFWIFMVLYILTTMDLIKIHVGMILPHLPGLASAWESIMLSFALAARYSNIHRENMRLQLIQKDVGVAKAFQKYMLPSSFPEKEHYELYGKFLPSGEVSGDFYDWVQLDDGRLVVFIADVSGHGYASGFISSMVKVAFQDAVYSNSRENEMNRINRMILDHVQGNFVTALMVKLNPKKGTMNVTRAGHTPLLYLHRDENRVESIVTPGRALGVLGNENYEEVEFPIKKGDRILLYTDGISEAMNRKRDLFGDERVEEFISSSQEQSIENMVESLVRNCMKWSGGYDQQDDITLVGIDILAEPQKKPTRKKPKKS